MKNSHIGWTYNSEYKYENFSINHNNQTHKK